MNVPYPSLDKLNDYSQGIVNINSQNSKSKVLKQTVFSISKHRQGWSALVAKYQHTVNKNIKFLDGT